MQFLDMKKNVNKSLVAEGIYLDNYIPLYSISEEDIEIVGTDYYSQETGKLRTTILPTVPGLSQEALQETLGENLIVVTRYKCGLCSFGILDLDISKRPKHGGLWDSNTEYINNIINTDLILVHAKLNNDRYDMAYFYSKKKLLPDLPEDYVLVSFFSALSIGDAITEDIVTKEDAKAYKAYLTVEQEGKIKAF